MRTLLTAALLVGTLGCGAPEPPPQIVLVVCDTLRADHMGCYGYPRPTTPQLDAFAEECLLFERCLAPIAHTTPSHLSLLTGVYPLEHGVEANKDLK